MIGARILVICAVLASLFIFFIFLRMEDTPAVVVTTSTTPTFSLSSSSSPASKTHKTASSSSLRPPPPPSPESASSAEADFPVVLSQRTATSPAATSIATLRGDVFDDHDCEFFDDDPAAAAKAPLCRPCVAYSSADELEPSDAVSTAVASNNLAAQNRILESRRVMPPAPCDMYEKQRARFFPNGSLSLSFASFTATFARVSILDALRILYRNASFDHILDKKKQSGPCILSLFHAKGACLSHVESMDDCVSRLGIFTAEQLVPDMCVLSPFWEAYRDGLRKRRGTAAEHGSSPPPSVPRSEKWKQFYRGVIPESTVRKTANEGMSWVAPAQRSYAILGEPLVCSDKLRIHPIGFAIPKSVMVDSVTRTKAFDFMPLLPGKHMGDRLYRTGVQQEGVFREMYASSYFAFTNNRGGWDCMRHYEILASGAIPYFPEIESCPAHTLTHLPRDLLAQALTMPGVEHVGKVVPNDRNFRRSNDHPFYEPIHSFHIHFKKPGTIVASKFNRKAYTKLAAKILNFTRHHLTCGAMVAAMLRRMGTSAEQAKKVLLVSRFSYDYLHASIQNGFSELGIKMTVVGENAVWMYKLRHPPGPLKDLSELKRGEALQRSPHLYGASFSQPHRAYAAEGGDIAEYITDKASLALAARIEAGEFDSVIYTYIHAGAMTTAPYIQNVKKRVHRDNIAFLDHDDANFYAVSEYKRAAEMGHVFARELSDERSCR